MMDQPYVTGLRIRETSAQGGYFDSGGGVRRGGGKGKKSKGKAKKVKKAEAAEKSVGPSDAWAKKTNYPMFQSTLTPAAMASSDGHDPTAQTSDKRAGTSSFNGNFNREFTQQPVDKKSSWRCSDGVTRHIDDMSHFFTGSGDTYENAEDKDAWMEQTMSGQYNCLFVSTEPPQAHNAGEMCPNDEFIWRVDANGVKSKSYGLHTASAEPIVDTFVVPTETTTDKPTLSEQEQVQVLAAAGELTRPDGSRYQTETGFQLAQQRVLDAAATK